jgi:hypothetical protein
VLHVHRYEITDKVPKPGHPDWRRVVAVIVMVGAMVLKSVILFKCE